MERTARAFTLSIMYVQPGEGNAAHTHEVEEVFFVLKGFLDVFLEDESGRRLTRRMQDEAHRLFPEAEVSDDGVSLTIATRAPAVVLSALADRNALRGLSVHGATLEDVFLALVGNDGTHESAKDQS